MPFILLSSILAIMKRGMRSTNFFGFTPLWLVSIPYFILLVIYINEQGEIVSRTMKDLAYVVLNNHPFLTESFKIWIASLALIVAWHRSITTEKQIDIQLSSKNISDFYDIKDHFQLIFSKNKKLDSREDDEYENYVNSIFIKIFESPKSGDFRINNNFKNNLEELLSSYKFLLRLVTGNELKFECKNSLKSNDFGDLESLYINMLRYIRSDRFFIKKYFLNSEYDEFNTQIKLLRLEHSLMRISFYTPKAKNYIFDLQELDKKEVMEIIIESIDNIFSVLEKVELLPVNVDAVNSFNEVKYSLVETINFHENQFKTFKTIKVLGKR